MATKLTEAHSLRFDRDESPDEINAGEGWTEKHVRDFCHRHDIVADIVCDPGFIRAIINEGGKFLKMRNVGTGVEAIVCEKHS